MTPRLTGRLIALAFIVAACTTPPAPTAAPTDAPATPPAASGSPAAIRPASPPASTATLEPAATPEPIDTAGLIRDAVTEADRADADHLKNTDVPPGNLRDLAIEFEGLPADTPEKTCTAAHPYDVGDQAVFHSFNNDTFEQFIVTATLIAKTEHAYMWLDNKWLSLANQDALRTAAETFSDKIYDRDRSLFGSEWTPGVDCDPRISILNTSNTAAGGVFSGVDEFTTAVRSDSNEREMFTMDLEGSGGPQEDYYYATLAHEFQHMILYHQDPNEDTWLSEGMSDLAIFLNGHEPVHDHIAVSQPDTQLNFWPEGGGSAANYGTAFSFMLYIWGRYGDAGVRAVVAEPANGLDGIQKVLDKIDPGKPVDDLVADWLVARYLDNPQIADGRYGYAQGRRPLVEIQQTVDHYPHEVQDSVHQYAGKYVALKGDRDITIDFAGSTQARLIDAQAHSGRYFWWSNRGDSATPRLTRAFDLSGVKTATLKYWTWYSLEKDWDYGYVLVSEDGGTTWKILTTPSGTSTNPNNNSYGWGYTGSSGGGEQPEWIQESVDLSAYAGQRIVVGFEVITDLAVNRPGMAIDDVEIPDINYREDFENGDGGWQPAGWVRTHNLVPQKFIVQLISFGKDGRPAVTRLPVDDDTTGHWDVPLSTLNQAVILVSGMAPKTDELARFNWRATQK